jgi:hypothetical protein
MLIFFWTVYALVAGFVLYQTLPPLQLELLILLGGIGCVLGAASLVLLWRTPSPTVSDERI